MALHCWEMWRSLRFQCQLHVSEEFPNPRGWVAVGRRHTTTHCDPRLSRMVHWTEATETAEFFSSRYVSCLRFFEKRRWALPAALSNRGALFRIRRLRVVWDVAIALLNVEMLWWCSTFPFFLSRENLNGQHVFLLFSCHWSMKNWSTSAHVTRWVNWITWPSWNCSWNNVSGWFFGEKTCMTLWWQFFCVFFWR